MSSFKDTIDDIENRFLANPEEVPLIVGLIIEVENIIDQTLDEINRGTLVALKIQNNNLITQSKNPTLGKTTCTRQKHDEGPKK